ncbi:MAG: succinate dehydrogenase [Granulosicoccus sp.]|nr:succinate dehydrogenase [Granulosicoccus sp.]
MLGVRLYFLQRLTAMIMAPLVLGHLGLMIIAVRGGLTAAEILSRTQGSVGWALFYGIFVVAVATHAAIGLRVIVAEVLGAGERVLNILTLILFIAFLYFGLQAVYAVVVT